MGWFRRRRQHTDTATTGGEAAAEIDAAPSGDRFLPVPVATAPALARTERALQMLAAQSSQLHAAVVQLEHRVDAMSAALVDQLDRPSYDDVLAARLHSAKVAAELARLEVNLAARLETVRNDIRVLRHADNRNADNRHVDVGFGEIDLRELTPADTGWSLPAG